jgi:hypothetical protein
MTELRKCPESAYGQHDPDRFGRCFWCNRYVSGPVSKPRPERHVISELEHHYRTMWDPDYCGEYSEDWRY